MTFEFAFSLFLLFVILLEIAFDIGMLALVCYLFVNFTNVAAPKSRYALKWTVLICAILIGFRTIVLDMLATYIAYRADAFDEAYWRFMTNDLIMLLIVACLASLPVILENRRREQLSVA